MNMAKKIYDFVGLKMHQNVKKMINDKKRKKRASTMEELNLFGVNKKKNKTSIGPILEML